MRVCLGSPAYVSNSRSGHEEEVDTFRHSPWSCPSKSNREATVHFCVSNDGPLLQKNEFFVSQPRTLKVFAGCNVSNAGGTYGYMWSGTSLPWPLVHG